MKVPKATQLPSGSWFVRVRVGGQDLSHTAQTEEECLRWAEATKANWNMDKRMVQLPAGKKTIGALMDEYMDQAQMSERTRMVYENVRNNHFQSIMRQPYNSIHGWNKVIAAELLEYNPNTVNLYWGKICAAIRHAGLEVPNVTIKTRPSAKKQYIEPKDLPRFLEIVRGDMYEIPYLMMLSSLRVREALAVNGTDLSEKGIHVRGTKTAASDRTVPWLIPRLKELCLPYFGKDEVLSTASVTGLHSHLNRICDDDFPGLTNHSLRYSFASLCYSMDVPERIAMRIGGWADITTMHRIYVQISDDDVQKYVDVINRFFDD